MGCPCGVRDRERDTRKERGQMQIVNGALEVLTVLKVESQMLDREWGNLRMGARGRGMDG